MPERSTPLAFGSNWGSDDHGCLLQRGCMAGRQLLAWPVLVAHNSRMRVGGKADLAAAGLRAMLTSANL